MGFDRRRVDGYGSQNSPAPAAPVPGKSTLTQAFGTGPAAASKLPTAGPAPTAPQSPVVQRSSTDDFSEVYKDKHGRVASNGGGAVDYDTYKAGLGGIKASSETTSNLTEAQQNAPAAQQMAIEMTEQDLMKIFDRDEVIDPWASEKAQKLAIDKLIQSWDIGDMLPRVNQAFRIMKLDTVGAQAAYLANAYVESDQFRYMTETSAAAGEKPFADQNAKLATGWLDKAAAGKVEGVGGYKEGGAINRNGNWEEAFIGRGPLQVTHEYGYASTLAILEKHLEELKAEGNITDAALVQRAFDAIKKDPKEAANPEYTFLFSAAYMKRPTGRDLKSTPGDQIASGGNNTGFMGPQFPDKKVIKDQVYKRAITVLTKRQHAQANQPPAPKP